MEERLKMPERYKRFCISVTEYLCLIDNSENCANSNIQARLFWGNYLSSKKKA